MIDLSLKTVTMKDGSQKIKLNSPFNPDIPKRARALGGAWNDTAKAWYFPTDLDTQLRQMCVEIYGIDPLAETPPDLVNVQFAYNPDYDTGSSSDSFWLFGRELLRRPGRDSSVRVGDGVSIISGGFRNSGGSRNNPSLGAAEDGTTLLVRNVPRAAALAFQVDNADAAIAITEQEPPRTLTLEQAKSAAGALATLLKQLSKEDRNTVIHELVASMEGVE